MENIVARSHTNIPVVWTYEGNIGGTLGNHW